MLENGFGFGAGLDGIVSRTFARAEPAKLWEHEPHLVNALPSGPQFGRYSHLGLRDDEAVEAEGDHVAACRRVAFLECVGDSDAVVEVQDLVFSSVRKAYLAGSPQA